MSVLVMGRVWKNSKFRGTKLLALIALADWSNDDGWSWYSIREIAKKLRLEKRQTKHILRTLSTEMELVIHSKAGWGGANLYWVAAGVQEFAPPPAILGLTVLEPPIYRGGTLVRGAILRSKNMQEFAPDTSLNVIGDDDVLIEDESIASEDSVRKPAPAMQEFAPLDLHSFLITLRISKKKRQEITNDKRAKLPYVQRWFAYVDLAGNKNGLAIVSILDHLPAPEFCDFCGGIDGDHRHYQWEGCPREGRPDLTTLECEEMTGRTRKVQLADVE